MQLVTARFIFEMPTPTYPGLVWQLPGTGTQPVTDRFVYELPPRARTQPVLDRSRDNLSDMPNSMPGYDRLLPRAEVYDSIRSPETDLMDTVAHLPLEVEALKFGQSGPSTLVMKTKPMEFTSTKVPA